MRVIPVVQRPTIIFREHNEFLDHMSEAHRLCRRIAEATDDDELFAGLNQLSEYLTWACLRRNFLLASRN